MKGSRIHPSLNLFHFFFLPLLLRDRPGVSFLSFRARATEKERDERGRKGTSVIRALSGACGSWESIQEPAVEDIDRFPGTSTVYTLAALEKKSFWVLPWGSLTSG